MFIRGIGTMRHAVAFVSIVKATVDARHAAINAAKVASSTHIVSWQLVRWSHCTQCHQSQYFIVQLSVRVDRLMVIAQLIVENVNVKNLTVKF